MGWGLDHLWPLWWCKRRNGFVILERPESMETELNAKYGILKLVMPMMQWQRKKHHIQCQMKVSLIFDLSLSLLHERNYIRVILSLSNIFYEFEQHLNKSLWFLHIGNPPSKSKMNITSARFFLVWNKTHLVSVLCKNVTTLEEFNGQEKNLQSLENYSSLVRN